MKSECIYEIINFQKYHQQNLIDFCPESLFRLGMLRTHLSRGALRIIKTNHISERNLQNSTNDDEFLNTFVLKCNNESLVSLSMSNINKGA